jgi:hypothetical protein
MDAVKDLRALRSVQRQGLDLASANDRELTAILVTPEIPPLELGGVLGGKLSETRRLVRLVLLADSGVPSGRLLVFFKRCALVPGLGKLEDASLEDLALGPGLGVFVEWVVGIRGKLGRIQRSREPVEEGQQANTHAIVDAAVHHIRPD